MEGSDRPHNMFSKRFSCTFSHLMAVQLHSSRSGIHVWSLVPAMVYCSFSISIFWMMNYGRIVCLHCGGISYSSSWPLHGLWLFWIRGSMPVVCAHHGQKCSKTPSNHSIHPRNAIPLFSCRKIRGRTQRKR